MCCCFMLWGVLWLWQGSSAVGTCTLVAAGAVVASGSGGNRPLSCAAHSVYACLLQGYGRMQIVLHNLLL